MLHFTSTKVQILTLYQYKSTNTDAEGRRCACCTRVRQLSLVRSLQHDANYVNGCFCKIETRQGAHVRALQRKKLVDAGKKKKRGVGRETSSIYVSSYCYICVLILLYLLQA